MLFNIAEYFLATSSNIEYNLVKKIDAVERSGMGLWEVWPFGTRKARSIAMRSLRL